MPYINGSWVPIDCWYYDNDYDNDLRDHNKDKKDIKEKDNINHPDYYQSNDHQYEVIDIIKAYNLDFHLGNVLKYILRAGKKNQSTYIEDLHKALWYIQDYISWQEKKE